MCLLCLLGLELLSHHFWTGKKPNLEGRKRRNRKEKVQFHARPQKRAIKSIRYYVVECMLIPMVAFMLTFELGHAMTINHGRQQNDSTLHGSVLSSNRNKLLHPVRSLCLVYNISISRSIFGQDLSSADGMHRNREKRSTVRF